MCFSCRGTGVVRGGRCPDCDNEQVVEEDDRSHFLTYQARREARNVASKQGAEHDKELWDVSEDQQLLEYWDEFPAEEVAEMLGRTIEACRQRRYTLLWALREGRNIQVRQLGKHTREKEAYVPIPAGPDEDQWWAPDYYVRRENA